MPDGAERPSLNDRQVAVLGLLFEGLRNSQIESRLAMTPSLNFHAKASDNVLLPRIPVHHSSDNRSRY
jgi:hypothetical protein